MISRHETEIAGAFVLQPKLLEDSRGIFSRLFCLDTFDALELEFDLRQINNSTSIQAGTVRGMHYQIAPFAEKKLMRCVSGKIYDVIFDLREDSPTYRQWFGVTLTASSRHMLYIPEGLAHGFQTLEDNTEVVYATSNQYSPEHERGLRWDDPALAIDWPITGDVNLSDKDQQWPPFESRHG